MSAQIVLFRELLVLLSGAELYAGFIFASWLIWAGCGSAVLGRSVPGGRSLQAGVLLASVVLAGTVALIRSAAPVLGTVPGEIVPPGTALLFAAAATAPCALLGGHLFAFAARSMGRVQTDPAEAGGSVYAGEAWGSAVAGVVLGIGVFHIAGTFLTAVALAALAAVPVLWRRADGRRAPLRAVVCALPVVLFFAGLPLLERADYVLESKRLPGYTIVSFTDSPYGRIDAVRRQQQAILYVNSVPVATVPGRAAAEERIHIALSAHPSPRSLLILGGSQGDLAREAERYRLERVAAVELDRAAYALGSTIGLTGAGPEIPVRFGDAREYLRTTRDSSDVILLAAAEPLSLQGNRLYTTECFSQIRRRLNPGGIFACSLPGFENLMLRTQERVYASIYAALSEVFPSVAVLPGATVHFLAGDHIPVARLPALIQDRLSRRDFDLHYLQPSTLAFRFSESRMDAVASVATPPFAVEANSDFGFSTCLYNTVNWYSRLGHSVAESMLPLIGRRRELLFIFIVLLALLHAGAVAVCARRSRQWSAVPSMALTGFSGMGGAVALLVAFQIVCGVLFQWVAVLTGVFMFGAGLGGLTTRRAPRLPGSGSVHLSLLAGFLIGAALLLLHGQRPFSATAAKMIFSILELGLGYVTGAAFVILCRQSGEGRSVVQRLYAVDLIGGAAGALIFAGCMLPLLGLPLATLLLAGINAVALAAAALTR